MPTNPNSKSLNPYLTSHLLHTGREHKEYYPSEMEFKGSLPEAIICCLSRSYREFSEMKPLWLNQKRKE